MNSVDATKDGCSGFIAEIRDKTMLKKKIKKFALHAKSVLILSRT